MRAAGSCEDFTAKRELSMKPGKVIANMHQIPRVCSRCWSQAPFLMKKAGIVQERRSASPA
jgi:hypothetical protein